MRFSATNAPPSFRTPGGNSSMSVGSSLAPATGFGLGVAADPTLVSSYPGLVSTFSGTVYLQTGPTSVAIDGGGANDPVYENRPSDAYGGGFWSWGTVANLAPNPFSFTSAAGWTLAGPQTNTASGITAPDGVTNAQKLYQTTSTFAEVVSTFAGTTAATTFSLWYQTDATNPPANPPYAAFLSGNYTCFPTGVLPNNIGSWTRAMNVATGGTTSGVGFCPSGSSAGGSAVNAGAGAATIWGFMATVSPHDLPLISGTATATKTLDAHHSAMLVDKHGDLDFEVTFQPSAGWGQEVASYLWSTTTADGLLALSYTVSNTFATYHLWVRGVDVLDTGVGLSTTTHQSQVGEPVTVRVWYNVSAGVMGIRTSVNGCYINDLTGSTTGSALAPVTTTVYLGSNMGSSTAAYGGRFKPYRRPKASLVAPPTVPVEGIMIGDSIVGPMDVDNVPLDAIGSYFYTQGSAGEWTTRPGIGNLAVAGDTITMALGRWTAATNKWRFSAAIKWVFVQIGINDVLSSESTAVVTASIQGLITQVKTDCPTTKIIISTMLPAGAKFVGYPADYAAWQGVNANILGTGGTPITGVDVRLDTAATTSPWNDGADNLAAAVDAGDHLHTTNHGRFLQAQDPTYGLRQAVHSLGLI